MNDFSIMLCCFNNQRIYCLEYTCLIISVIIFPCNILGLLVITWSLVHSYCEIIYSINLTISFFSILIISIIIYSTKVGKVISNELNKLYVILVFLTLFFSIYIFIAYALSSFEIFRGYLLAFYQEKGNELFSSIEKIKIVKMLNSKITWILVSLASLLPLLLSFINILVWISIYLRIRNRIYCSFNKEIRKELRKQKKFKKFQDSNVNEINESEKDKNKYRKDLISIVIEKDRHPGISGFISKGTNSNKNTNNYSENNDYQNKFNNQMHRKRKKNKDGDNLDFVSSERKFDKNDKIVPEIE